MKLIPCPACGQSVAKNAKACPHCGRQRPGKDLADYVMQWGLVLVIGFALAFFFYVFATAGSR